MTVNKKGRCDCCCKQATIKLSINREDYIPTVYALCVECAKEMRNYLNEQIEEQELPPNFLISRGKYIG